MATYYVRPDGSDTNAGTGPATNQAWKTVSKALGSAGISSGDTVYIAPGIYRESVTVSVTNPSAVTTVYGDSNATQFSGISPGIVRITYYTVSDNSTTSSGTGITNTRDYFTWRDITFVCNVSSTGSNTTFYRCVFETALLAISPTGTSNTNITIDSCIFLGRLSNSALLFTYPRAATSYTPNTVIKNCLINCDVGTNSGVRFALSGTGSGFANDVLITNCTILNVARGVDTYFMGGLTGRVALVQNSVINSNVAVGCDVSGQIALQNNRYSGGVTNGTLISGNTSTMSFMGIDLGQSRLNGIPNQMFTNSNTSVNIGYGIITSAPTVDLYNNAWSTGVPDAGSGAYISNASTSFYLPTERNASTITIAPGSTSQSIELYLGATGLTYATSGLAAYYVRNQSAPVAITLVTQTATGAWSSGGFAEISSSLVPGVYRLDVPNAALAAGVSDVTIVVRGASGTNGAVLTVTLSSGGLTAAQTAAAVWDEPYTSHTTASTFGARTLKTVEDNRLVNVGTANHIESNIHAVVNSTAAASELSGALLHNGTDYIDSNLISGNSTRVFVGRFDLRQTGSETVDTIEVFTTDTPSFELQLTDGDGNEVPVTGATLGLRILDVASTVVETGTPTVEYGTGGIVRWTGPGTYLAIGCPVGMYRLFIDRTVSGTTTTFGPLQIKVQAQ
jgi:hypothetical protein